MATVGTITQTKDVFGLLNVTLTGITGAGNAGVPFLSQGYPFGSAQIILTSGAEAVGDKLYLDASNDGTNFFIIGTLTNPNIDNAFFALSSTSTLDAPAKYYRFHLDGGNTGTGVYTITCILMGTRG